MKLKEYILRAFSEEETKDIDTVTVPQDSHFVAAKILHDGVYVWYAIPDELTIEDKIESFVLLKPHQTIPENCDFIDILDTIIESQQGQGILILPLYKLK